MTGESFIYGIINHFIDHVVQPGTVICIADIHARAFTHGLQTFEDLD